MQTAANHGTRAAPPPRQQCRSQLDDRTVAIGTDEDGAGPRCGAVRHRREAGRRPPVGGRPRPGRRRATEPPVGNAWSTGQLARHIGMSRKFVIDQILIDQIRASRFGREWRIASAEVRCYCEARAFPVPESVAQRRSS